MAVIFPRWTNWTPFIALGGLAAGGLFTVFGIWYWFSPKFTDVGYAPKQPVAFSHKFHAGTLGLDCRYCHYTVDKSSYAAIPPTQVCMGCHTQVLPKSKKLAKVRLSYKKNKPIRWVNVHMLPDYAFFNHKVHVASGVGCATCHGRIDKMEVVAQAKPLSMSWCLDCHRNPNPNLRPRNQVTNMLWDRLKAKKIVSYQPTKDKERTRRKDIKRHRSDVKKGYTVQRHRGLQDLAAFMIKGTHKRTGKDMKTSHIVVNPPEHCSGCHR